MTENDKTVDINDTKLGKVTGGTGAGNKVDPESPNCISTSRNRYTPIDPNSVRKCSSCLYFDASSGECYADLI